MPGTKQLAIPLDLYELLTARAGEHDLTVEAYAAVALRLVTSPWLSRRLVDGASTERVVAAEMEDGTAEWRWTDSRHPMRLGEVTCPHDGSQGAWFL